MISRANVRGGIIPQIRILKCSKCDSRVRQRMNEQGRFENIKICDRCGGRMETLRILTQVPT